MKRVNFYIPPDAWRDIREAAKERGLSAAALIRMLIADFLTNKNNDHEN